MLCLQLPCLCAGSGNAGDQTQTLCFCVSLNLLFKTYRVRAAVGCPTDAVCSVLLAGLWRALNAIPAGLQWRKLPVLPSSVRDARGRAAHGTRHSTSGMEQLLS